MGRQEINDNYYEAVFNVLFRRVSDRARYPYSRSLTAFPTSLSV